MASIVETIGQRIAELEEELGRLRAAQAALVTGPRSAARPQSRTRSKSSRSSKPATKRAPRGLRIEQTRKFLAKNPKAKDTEIASALGISRQQAQQLRKKIQTTN